MPMADKQRDKWAKTRPMGRTKFVLLNGVLGWGVSVAVGWSVAMTAMNGRWDRFPLTFLIAIIGFPIGGYFVGRVMWAQPEKAFADDRAPARRGRIRGAGNVPGARIFGARFLKRLLQSAQFQFRAPPHHRSGTRDRGHSRRAHGPHVTPVPMGPLSSGGAPCPLRPCPRRARPFRPH
jgi:hypothetical protein